MLGNYYSQLTYCQAKRCNDHNISINLVLILVIQLIVLVII